MTTDEGGSGVHGGVSAGPLMVIGGAEDKLRRRTVLVEFVRLAGGDAARVVVVPSASALGPEVVDLYDALFRSLGAGEVAAVWPRTRDEAHDPALVERIDAATGVYMTGGNQLKLSGIVAGTPVGDAIVAAHRRGAVVGGTSAGASVQSSHMVAFGPGGATPRQRMTQVAAGLGLLEGVVVDQHFEQRNRYGRLLMIVSQSPQLLGIGVDEDTAAIVEVEGGRQVLRVLGRGAVTLLDPARIVTDAHEVPRSKPILASGVVLHVLTEGSRFDLGKRELLSVPDATDAEEAAAIVSAGHDVAGLAADIAAADASPSVLRRRLTRRRGRKTDETVPAPTDAPQEDHL